MADEHEYPYTALSAELKKTGVISQEFKSLILGYAQIISQDSYERGRQFERGLHVIKQVREDPKEGEVIGKLVRREPDLHEEFTSWLEAKGIDPASLTHSRQAELAGVWLVETTR